MPTGTSLGVSGSFKRGGSVVIDVATEVGGEETAAFIFRFVLIGARR